MPKPGKTAKRKNRLRWVKVPSGAWVLKADDVPLWDVYEDLFVDPAKPRWFTSPYTLGSRKAGPFRTAKEAKRFVEDESVAWLADVLQHAMAQIRAERKR